MTEPGPPQPPKPTLKLNPKGDGPPKPGDGAGPKFRVTRSPFAPKVKPADGPAPALGAGPVPTPGAGPAPAPVAKQSMVGPIIFLILDLLVFAIAILLILGIFGMFSILDIF